MTIFQNRIGVFLVVAALGLANDAPGVDASSGLEISPGVKSAELIHAFVAAARATAFAAEPQS